MSDLTLYNLCLWRVFTNLRNGFYMNNNKNHFKQLPFKIVNSIMSVAWDQKHMLRFRVEYLVKLLQSNSLSELQISVLRANQQQFGMRLQLIYDILNSLASKEYCKNLETLHLLVAGIWFEYEETLRILRVGIRETLQIILPKILNLKYLICSFRFNLTFLRKFRNLRMLRLHFEPQQRWCEFLEEEEGHFQTHTDLKLFSVCPKHLTTGNVPYHDIVIILQNCPELVSLGLIESSGALSLLHRKSPSVTKLRHCRWLDIKSPSYAPHLVGDAIRVCPLIEELDFDNCNSRSIPCLRNLKHLVCLDITLDASVSSDAFNSVLREIGSRLMHLSFEAAIPMDISLLLRNCPNLESLRIVGAKFSNFAHPSVSLPNLQRLTVDYTVYDDKEGRLLRLLYSCNQLTDLFLIDVYLDDNILVDFLEWNSVSNLKLVYLSESNLTENGLRKLLQNGSQLEMINICAYKISNADSFRRVIFQTNLRVRLFNKDGFLLEDEFFEKRKKRYQC